MRHEFSSNLLHNPFYNRFNVPVTQRRDSLQAHANVVWLHEHDRRSLSDKAVSVTEQTNDQVIKESHSTAQTVVSVFALLLVLLATILMLSRGL